MKRRLYGLVAILLLVLPGQSIGGGAPKPQASKPQDALLTVMQQELRRARSELGKLDPAPYYVSYSVYDQDNTVVVGGQGALVGSSRMRQRHANVVMRVGSNVLDNTHEENRSSGITEGLLPLADDLDAVAHVLPDFLTAVDDPTVSSFEGQSLMGNYEVDDEGVKAVRVPVIEKGQLVNYLLGREPIRDFPVSNGHGRAPVGGPPAANLGNLFVQSSEGLSDEDLKKKLVEICKQRDLPYGYLVETLSPQLAPRLLYRVWVKDGRQELVRGAIFGELDVRSLRSNIIAAGKHLTVESSFQPIPQSVLSPALLFDELEIKRADASKEKLPEYPAPAVTSSK